MKYHAQKIVVSVIAAAAAIVAVGAHATSTPTTPYVFRMPYPGLKGQGVAGGSGSAGTVTVGSQLAVPVDVSMMTFALRGETLHVTTDGGGSFSYLGDEVDGQVAVRPGAIVTVDMVDMDSGWGTVALYVGDRLIAVADGGNATATSRVGDGVTVTSLTPGGLVAGATTQDYGDASVTFK